MQASDAVAIVRRRRAVCLLPGCSFEVLERSIHEKLFTLPDDTIVLPGHGQSTTIGREKRTNPFVGAPAGYAN
jgi:glyoxylase-like metal-dependent hydrolase (beta-lactamase superfamily II)